MGMAASSDGLAGDASVAGFRSFLALMESTVEFSPADAKSSETQRIMAIPEHILDDISSVTAAAGVGATGPEVVEEAAYETMEDEGNVDAAVNAAVNDEEDEEEFAVEVYTREEFDELEQAYAE